MVDFNKIIGVQEAYKATDKLMEILMTKPKSFFDKLIENGIDFDGDIFRDYFQDQHADREKFKQDYTPECLSELLCGLSEIGDTVADICAGTGSLAIAAWKKNKNAFFHCEESSERVAPFLLANLSIRNISAEVVVGDCLENGIKHIYKLTPTEKYSEITKINDIKAMKYDTVISNPPFSANWNPNKENVLDGYELPPKSKADYAFIMRGLKILKDNGEMFCILPHGVLFRGAAEGKIRKKLVEDKLIRGIIGLPEKLFMNTQIPVCILAFSFGNEKTLIIDASKSYEKGKKQNKLSKEQTEKIISTFKKNTETGKYSHIAEISEIQGNDYNLNIPRYVDTFEETPLPDIDLICDCAEEMTKTIRENELNIYKMLLGLRATTKDAESSLKKFRDYFKNVINGKVLTSSSELEEFKKYALAMMFPQKGENVPNWRAGIFVDENDNEVDVETIPIEILEKIACEE